MVFILIYVTHKNLEEAKKVGNELLKEKLIACANYYPIKSSYWWQGKIENSEEYVSLLKTKKENWYAVKEKIKKIHPYKVPCIMKMDVEANEDYDSWVKEETQ